ncbi:acetate uptake transporter family protein [Pseudonocardia xinjiangensis]|uniref:acetate uptake transporter family protein n=1 Tax=Pseudonocardia xinjiangensis TaxID=75289 RepID=UPI003D8C80EE
MSTDINGHSPIAEAPDYNFWRDRTRITLSPVAAPSILGLFGFAAATFMVAGNLAGWYGNAQTPLVLFPFALTAGGLAQFLAGMWAYRARDAVATAMHGMWGAFWIAYGMYNLLIALGVLPSVASATAAGAFGFWFVVLAAITLVGAIAAAAENIVLTGVLVMLAAGSTLLAIALLGGLPLVQAIGAYLLIISALLAWYLASAMMIQSSFKRAVLPIGSRRPPGTSHAIPPHNNVIHFAAGEPGVKIGQ